MESGRTPSTGAKADREGLSMTFKYAPSWHLALIDETVDVAKAGDTAIYLGTYAEDSLHDGACPSRTMGITSQDSGAIRTVCGGCIGRSSPGSRLLIRSDDTLGLASGSFPPIAAANDAFRH